MINYFEQLSNATFLYPLFLWGLPLVAFVAAGVAIKNRRLSIALVLKAIAFCLLLVAAATPLKTTDETSSHLVAVVDTSASIPEAALKSFAKVLSTVSSKEGEELSLLSFAKTTAQPVAAAKQADTLFDQLRAAQSANSAATDIAQALSSVASTTQASAYLLLSDGKQTTGDAITQAKSLASQGIRIFPILPDIGLFSQKGLSISTLHAPLTTYLDQQPTVHVAVRNDSDQEKQALVAVSLDDKTFLEKSVSVAAHSEVIIREIAPMKEGGLQKLHAVVREGNKVIDQEHRWISVKERTKMVMLSGSAEDADLLERALQSKGYTIVSSIAGGSTPLPKLDRVSLLIFNNVHKQQVSDQFLNELQTFVQGGGGLVLVGGEKSFGLGRYKDTVLEQLSPVNFVPPQTSKKRLNNAVMLVIDKSRSMTEQNRIDAARKAAISSINSLRDDDFVGVIGFDDAPFPIIKMQEVAKAKGIAASRLRNLTAAGGTALLKSLSEARKQLERVEAGRKHIIVLSDGVIPDASQLIFQELEKLKAQGVTISTIALGQDADVPFMNTLAEQGHGGFYQVTDVYRLPEIFLKDIKVATGERTMREQQRFAVYQGPDGVVSTSLKHFPELLGYVQTIKKSAAALELVVKDKEGAFPILASWKIGGGKVTAFTSDANGRWSAQWARWNGFVEFWSDIVENTKGSTGEKQEVDFDLRYQIDGNRLVLDLSVYDAQLATQTAPSITAKFKTPSGESKQAIFLESKKGRFQSVIEAIEAGDYRIEISYGENQFPPLAVTISPESLGEKSGEGVNLELLSELAQITNATLNPNLQNIPRSVRIQSQRDYLNAPLFLLAFALFLLGTLVREGVELAKPIGGSIARRGIHDSMRK